MSKVLDAATKLVTKEEAETEKLLSEAALRRFRLESERKNGPKEDELILARRQAEVEKIKNESQKAHFEAACAELIFNNAKREEDKILTGDRYNKVYRFVHEVCHESVADCMMILSRWSRLEPECAMEIVFCSPGGSIIDGFALFDFIQDLKAKGHKVTTKSIGYAASMAGVLLQAGSDRVMGRESWLLIHEASFFAMGKIGAVDDTVEWIKRMCDRIVDIFAERASEKTGKSVKAIRATIKKNWLRKDWWLSADEALEYGFCDRIS